MKKIISLLAVGVPLAALGTSLIPHTVAQRALASDRVVVAEVLQRETVTDPTDDRRLKTHTRLLVRENLRGSGPSQVTLVQLGGARGNLSVEIPGDAHFEVHERAVLFLHCPVAERCYLVAMGEGRLPIVDRDFVVIHDLFTHGSVRRPLKELALEIRALPPGKVLGPLASRPGERR